MRPTPEVVPVPVPAPRRPPVAECGWPLTLDGASGTGCDVDVSSGPCPEHGRASRHHRALDALDADPAAAGVEPVAVALRELLLAVLDYDLTGHVRDLADTLLDRIADAEGIDL